MKNIKNALSRNEMRMIFGGKIDPNRGGLDAPCGSNSCTSSSECTEMCTAGTYGPYKQSCVSVACERNGSTTPNSIYMTCSC